ncbi:TPA: hypothetical protein L4968_005491 [Pseudomonas aeruginosa]|nr:hypothetical protein [Pseudomonas aeruginosa]HBO7189761.1 hypothetical protein [Pseudomonas aeruginosa]
MDEPLFNELLESVKQADQIMSDHAELRRLAELATATRPDWYTEDGNNWFLPRDCMNWIAAANPQAILGLLERLRLTELKGLMDAQRNMDLIKDIGRLKQQNDLMLNAIVKSRTALMVGRPTSKVAGQKYTEAFAAIVAALEGATQ